MIKNILMPSDFSKASANAVGLAVQLAEATKAHLWLIHAAAPDPDFVGYEAGPDSARSQVAAHLRDQHRSLQAKADEIQSDKPVATGSDSLFEFNA